MALADILGRQRAALLLLHPTSLPDPVGQSYGVGELGSQALALVDRAADAGVLAWQVLPLGHTGYGNSPYQTFSRYAGSPYLVSVERLRSSGDLTAAQHDAYVGSVRRAETRWGGEAGRADYGWLFEFKVGRAWAADPRADAVLRQAYANVADRSGPRQEALDRFCAQQADWLNPYAEFMALKELHGHRSWDGWRAPYRDIALWRGQRERLLVEVPDLARTIAYYRYLQFVFYEQWEEVRDRARARGRVIIGDLPWYVGYDSADVWAHPQAFDLDATGLPVYVAGVPPDYFSRTGQLWGNPLYRWWDLSGNLASEAVEWWVSAIAHNLQLVDLVRIDHFRAIDTYWMIPYGSETARVGVWAKGPGQALLTALRERLNVEQLPLIAEDLGYFDPLAPHAEAYPPHIAADRRFAVDPRFCRLIEGRAPELAAGLAEGGLLYRPRQAVDAVLRAFDLPWMGILQFGFEEEERFWPDHLIENSVLYTGTHDNDTSLGWYVDMVYAETQGRFGGGGQPVAGASRFDAYMARFERVRETGVQRNVSWDMIEVALSTRSALAGIPAGDLLCLGSAGRLNLPGDTSRPWWDYRFSSAALWDRAPWGRLGTLLRHRGRHA